MRPDWRCGSRQCAWAADLSRHCRSFGMLRGERSKRASTYCLSKACPGHPLAVITGQGDEALLRADVPVIHVLALSAQEKFEATIKARKPFRSRVSPAGRRCWHKSGAF